MPKKMKTGGGAGCPLWMMTFGDCMSLLVTFFVMLISFTNLEQEKLMDVIGSLRGALGAGPTLRVIEAIDHQRMTGESPVPHWLSVSDLSVVLPDARMAVRRFGRPQASDVSIEIVVRMLDEGLAFLISADPMFEAGRAVLLPENEELFEQVGGFLSGYANEVRVVGVIPGDVQVRDAGVRTPQGLGLARAGVVLEHLVEHGGLDQNRFGTGARLGNGDDGNQGRPLPAERIEIIMVGHEPARDVSPEAIIVHDKWR